MLQLPGSVFWRTKEELARERDNEELDPDLHYVTLEDHMLLLSQNYMDAVSFLLSVILLFVFLYTFFDKFYY